MAEKLKSLTLTKSKLADVEGEHRVTFIASSPNEDRDYEHVAIKTFRLPLKGGGHIVVQDIPENGVDNVDIPLLMDHDLYSVEKVIGSVRNAFFQDGNLVFEAGISSRPIAQDMFKLLDEGHLDNAFSIQYRDYQHESNTDYNGEIIEVSLVTRGSNMDASVLAVKSVKGEQVEEPTQTPEAVEEVKAEDSEAVEETVKVEETAEAEATEPKEDATEEKSAEAETDSETDGEEAKAEEVSEAENTNTNEKEENAMDNIAKGLVEKADQNVTAKSADTAYLKSKSAAVDYAKLAIKMQGASSEAVAKAWKKELEAKGITGGENILPTRLENIFFKGWDDDSSILSTFRIIRSRASAMNAFLGKGEGIRAKGHKKGETKANQEMELIRRDLKQKVVYKKLPIDLQDILDDETGELLAFRSEELSDRVLTAIAEGAVPGDGRSAGTPDYRIFDGSRGLWSMVADLNVAATELGEEPTDAEKYAHAVATVVEADANDNIYDKIIKALKFVKDKGYGKAVVVPFGTISDLKLEKLPNGNYLFQPGTSPEGAIEARVFEMDTLAGSGYDVVAYAINAYGAYISNEMVRFDFDTSKNEDIMLVERAVAGSLYGNMACAGYPSATTSA